VLSIVIPVYNERDSLLPLYAEVAAVGRRLGLDLEVLFVDDGSRDGSWAFIEELAARHPDVHGIRFRRNFGKAAALSAGFRAAHGEFVLTLDADLQDDPAEIPRFLVALEQGAEGGQPLTAPDGTPLPPTGGALDVVSGWKRVRHDPWHKVFPSRVFNGLVSWLTGVRLHDHNCGMKCYRAEVFREVRLYGELHRFIPVLAAARGFRVGEIEINHRPRRFGHSKYGVRRFVKGFLDLLTVKFLTGFGQRPQHALGTFGLCSFLLGGLALLYLAVTWVIRLWRPDEFEPLHQRPLLVYALGALLLGAQMMSIGFLAELLTAYRGRDEEWYSILEQTAGAAASPWLRPGPGEGDRAPAPPPAREALFAPPPEGPSSPATPPGHDHP
jgi:dolichol-phosphate mannosyltransferase